MPLPAEVWVSQVRLAVQQYFPAAELQIEIVRETRVKARLTISEDHFVDLFFREETGGLITRSLSMTGVCLGLTILADGMSTHSMILRATGPVLN